MDFLRSLRTVRARHARSLPQRLDASYVAPDGSRARPLMIHHAIFGSLGRMIAILLEHHGGVLPFWLSPDQVSVAPISKDQAGYGADTLSVLSTNASGHTSGTQTRSPRDTSAGAVARSSIVVVPLSDIDFQAGIAIGKFHGVISATGPPVRAAVGP